MSRSSRWASKTFGSAAAPTSGTEEFYWGPEGTWLGDERYSGERQLAEPLGAVQMGLIYVNPKDRTAIRPGRCAKDIREMFFRMAMNDEETVALIAGGHTLGKTHGGRPVADRLGAGRRRYRGSGPRLEEHAWHRLGADTITGGPEVTRRKRRLGSNHFFENLFVRMGADEEPAGAQQWKAKGAKPRSRTPSTSQEACAHAHHDLSLRVDPAYEKSRGASTNILTSSRTHSPAHGSSLRIATWPDRALFGPLSRRRR
jgi:catalase-peroxidase